MRIFPKIAISKSIAILGLLSVFIVPSYLQAQQLTEITGFGTNPGALKMFVHVPASLPDSLSVVVVMHGCTQDAAVCASNTGWNDIADRYGAIIIYPEQQYLNNFSYCFNWFLSADQERGSGEALSVKQMVDYVHAAYTVKSNSTFVTGLSAGGSMTTVLMATYPDVFSAGAVMAGAPYKAATNITEASSAMYGYVNKTPGEWKSLVLNAFPGYGGSYPRLAVFFGSLDPVVSTVNQTELIEQWSAVHNISTVPDAAVSPVNGASLVTQELFMDNTYTSIIENYTFTGMGHAIAVDPGACPFQGGESDTYAVDLNFHSTWWASRFFGFVDELTISGPVLVSLNQTGLFYSVPAEAGATWIWTVTGSAAIVNGQGTNQITVNWGSDNAGTIKVVKTDNQGCVFPEATLEVSAGTGLSEFEINRESMVVKQVEEYFWDVECRGAEHWALIDMQGRELSAGEFSVGRSKISMPISPGIYILHAKGDNFNTSKKLFVPLHK